MMVTWFSEIRREGGKDLGMSEGMVMTEYFYNIVLAIL